MSFHILFKLEVLKQKAIMQFPLYNLNWLICLLHKYESFMKSYKTCLYFLHYLNFHWYTIITMIITTSTPTIITVATIICVMSVSGWGQEVPAAQRHIRPPPGAGAHSTAAILSQACTQNHRCFHGQVSGKHSTINWLMLVLFGNIIDNILPFANNNGPECNYKSFIWYYPLNCNKRTFSLLYWIKLNWIIEYLPFAFRPHPLLNKSMAISSKLLSTLYATSWSVYIIISIFTGQKSWFFVVEILSVL